MPHNLDFKSFVLKTKDVHYTNPYNIEYNVFVYCPKQFEAMLTIFHISTNNNSGNSCIYILRLPRLHNTIPTSTRISFPL